MPRPIFSSCATQRNVFQDLRLNYMFTLSAVVTNTFALPIGILLDHAGPRNTALVGAACFALGLLAFGLEVVTTRKLLYICLSGFDPHKTDAPLH